MPGLVANDLGRGIPQRPHDCARPLVTDSRCKKQVMGRGKRSNHELSHYPTHCTPFTVCEAQACRITTRATSTLGLCALCVVSVTGAPPLTVACTNQNRTNQTHAGVPFSLVGLQTAFKVLFPPR